MSDRPNFLILMADQLTARALPAYGNRVAKTPHIDALAAAGVVFESFYCNSPLCAPSRFSFLSGRQISAIGAYDNAAEFPAQVPTFAHYLRRAGYQTVLSGKMHFCGADQLHGFEERLTTDIYPADFGWTPDWNRFEQRPSWYHTMDSVTQAGPCARTNQIDFDDEVVFQARQKLFDMARSKDRRPFCMVASHDPSARSLRDSAPLLGSLCRTSTSICRACGWPPADLDPHSRRLRHVCGLDTQPVTEAQVRAARRAYYGAVSYVDDQVGVLLAALAEARFADDTIVLLLADHGDMLGERGLWYKMSFFEPACRIPLIVHAPGRFAARRVAHSASLIDMAPTLCELAGGSSRRLRRRRWTARSLAAAARGRRRARRGHRRVPGRGRDRAAGDDQARAATSSCIPPSIPISSTIWPTIRTSCDNLAARRRHARARCGELRAEVARRWDLDALHAAVIASQRRRHFVYEALRAGRYTPWDFQPAARCEPAVRAQRSETGRSGGHGAISAVSRLNRLTADEPARVRYLPSS